MGNSSANPNNTYSDMLTHTMCQAHAVAPAEGVFLAGWP